MSIAPKLALISVSDKTNLIPFARFLHERGIGLLSTGGTATALKAAGIPVTEVADHTGFPEIMDGRVKTLHPKIHGGILGRRGEDDAVMEAQGIAPIDLVIVNLYPFQETVKQPGCTLAKAIENIDVGGPTMIRAAAKNHKHVVVVVDPQDYEGLQQALESQGAISLDMAAQLATKAFGHTAEYDAAISLYLQSQYTPTEDHLPATLQLSWHKVDSLRYGENPHQGAALYAINGQREGFTDMQQHQGKPLSYNNLADADAAVRCLREFTQHPACVIVKHANPCGVAQADSIEQAYQWAYETDSTSAFGGIIAFNRPLDEVTARRIIEQQFVEVIIAPSIDERAFLHLANKPNVRVLSFPIHEVSLGLQMHSLMGGVLVQTPDLTMVDQAAMRVATTRQPTEDEWQDMLFALRVVKHVKSNAIVYAKNGQTLGVGAGQTSRVASSQIAVWKAADAGLSLTGSVMASDAFFPFRDSIDAAAQAGIRAIIQPGGSMRDDEVIAAANEHGIAMVLTGVRHFKH
jgi:phosphoribosylaminoimidazolecarboxamide formyltransferase / IMP cyclohydrolase